MKFDIFIKLYKVKAKENRAAGEKYIDEIMEQKYVPFEDKVARINTIIDNTYYVNEDGEKVFHIDSAAAHLFTMLTFVDLYTKIEIDFKNAVGQYNALKECGALDIIVSKINESELNEFKFLWDAINKNLVMNEYDIHAYVNKQLKYIASIFEKVVTPFLDKINAEDVQNVLSQFDLKKAK